MIAYKNFRFGREDEHNINLYQIQNKEIVEGGGRGKGRGVATGRFEDREVFIGHYSTISGVLFKILEMDLEEASEVKEFNNKLITHRMFCEKLFKDKKLFIEKAETVVED